MSTKSLIVLVLATAVAVAAAFYAVNARSTDGAEGARGELLYPDLADRVNDAALLEVTPAGGETIEIARGDGVDDRTWGLAAKGGYPVAFERVKQTILTLAELEILERKTSRPENFDRLGLLDPAETGATSTRLVLRDRAGEELADLIAGDARGADGVYVRRHGEDQTWLVEGSFDLPPRPVDWVDTGVVQIQRERLARVRVAHPDGELLELERASRESPSWSVRELPAGRELRTASAPAPVGDALAWVSLEDVRPADQVDFSGATVSTWRTFDGLELTVETVQVDGVWWTRYAAAQVEPIAPASAAGAEGEEGEAGPPVVDPAVQEAAAGVPDEVAELNARLAPWAFAVSDYKAANYVKRMEELLKPLPVQALPDEPTDDAGEAPVDVPAPAPVEPPVEPQVEPAVEPAVEAGDGSSD